MIINHQLVFSINESIPIYFMACYDSLCSLDMFNSIPNNGTEENHFCICDLYRVRNGDIEDRELLQRSYLATRFDLSYSLALLLGLPQYNNPESTLLIRTPAKKIIQ